MLSAALSGRAPAVSADSGRRQRLFEKTALYQGFPAIGAVGTAFAIEGLQDTTFHRRRIMKFESLMLHTLFAACLLVCGLTLGSMLNAHPGAVHLAAGSHTSAVQPSAPTS